MSDVVSGVRQLIQDLVAPDLKAIKVSLDDRSNQLEMSESMLLRHQELISRQSELQFQAIMSNLDSFRAEMRAEMSALRTTSKSEVTEQLSPIIERVARLEALIETRQ